MRMPKTIEIVIPVKHLKNGEYTSNENCPIALTLKDAGYEKVNMGVGDGAIWPFIESKTPVYYKWSLKDNAVIHKMNRGEIKRKPVPLTLTRF